MLPRQVLDLYDDRYAGTYEDRFLRGELAAVDAAFEVQALGSLLLPGRSWLDVACGTGYFLSKFPSHLRAGLDLSPDMLRRAQAANPGVSFREADFRAPQDDWNEQWDVVSCMWYAYTLVESMNDVLCVLDNLVRWIAPGGDLFLPVADPRLISGCELPYHDATTPWQGQVHITGILWSYTEDDGTKRHGHLVTPHIELIQETLGPYFQEVELLSYPPAIPGWTGVRRALVGRGRLAGGPPVAEAASSVERGQISANRTRATAQVDTQRLSSLSVVIPAFNEAATLESVARGALAVAAQLADEVEVLVVDDGSQDATGRIADQLATSDRRFQVVHHAHNRGFGAAQRSGLAAARGEFIALIPADGQFNPVDLAPLAQAAPGADIVLGVRTSRPGDGWYRRVKSAVFRQVTRRVFRLPFRDVNWVKLYRRGVFESLEIASDGIGIETEAIAKAHRRGLRLVEVEVGYHPRTAGQAQGDVPSRVVGTVIELWRLRRG